MDLGSRNIASFPKSGNMCRCFQSNPQKRANNKRGRMHILTAAGMIPLAIFAATVNAKGLFAFDFEELSDGVWAGVRADAPRFPVMGNTTFVVGDNGVVVFDGGGMPAMSEQLIEKIRSVTDKPVTYVVMSHWHGDHLFGVYRFAEEYPGVHFVAHEFTRDVINSTRMS
jgi:glyoxylase-like metal-dependent hydrolase (beta-lactamase superfamily II)